MPRRPAKHESSVVHVPPPADGPELVEARALPHHVAEPLMIVRGKAAETAIDAIFDKGRNWTRRPNKAPIYGDDRDGAYVALGDPLTRMTATQEDGAWRKVLALDDQTAQTFLYVMALCLAAADPSAGGFGRARMHVSDVLAFRGVQRHHKGDFRPEQKAEERVRLMTLSDMFVVGRDIIIERRGKSMRKKPIVLTSRLIIVAVETEGQVGTQMVLPEDEESLEGPIYGFRVSLGEWAQPYIAASGYVREILSRIMQYDPTRGVERIALRLGLLLHLRTLDRRSVHELLDAARIEIPERNAHRLRERFEAALDLLVADGIIGSWTYVGDSTVPAYRWLNVWLQHEIAFTASTVVRRELLPNFAV